jgi:hypothetical protein
MEEYFVQQICGQFEMELHRPIRSKRKTKTPKRISSNGTEK